MRETVLESVCVLERVYQRVSILCMIECILCIRECVLRVCVRECGVYERVCVRECVCIRESVSESEYSVYDRMHSLY